jgi:hypothetical protein
MPFVFSHPLSAFSQKLLVDPQVVETWGRRMKVAEKGAKALLVETQALRHEMVVCSNNLDKAENEVQNAANQSITGEQKNYILMPERKNYCMNSTVNIRV